jgi:hypothetical protein
MNMCWMTRLCRPSTLVTAIAIAIAICGSSCSPGIPKPKPVPVVAGTPQVTWVVMSGDRENPDRDFVCQSDSPGRCVVPVSRPDEQVFSDVHVYYHGADTDIKYVGAIRIGFFRRSSDTEQIQTNLTVKKGEPIGNQSVVGIVTDVPGSYEIAFNLSAESVPPGNNREIRQRLPIVVK